LIVSLKIFLFGKHFYFNDHKGCEIFPTLIGEWLKKSLKQCDFEPSRPKTKNLVLFPKTKDLFLPPQSLELVPCTPKCPHNHENPLNTLDVYSLL
jgi:hypothetical protein